MKLHTRPLLAAVAVVAMQVSSVGAQVRTERTISLALANEIAAETVAACAAKNFAVTATVVDRSAQIKAVQRADNAGPTTLSSAYKKAYTAASFRAPTSAVMANMQKNPEAANLWHIDGVIGLGGGVPIRSGNEVVGGVGVGGAPLGSIDEECANTALAKVKDKLN